MSISQTIYDQTGQVIPPGATGECPLCGVKAFTIASTGTVGACSECFQRMTEHSPATGKAALLAPFLSELTLVFALSLWRAADRVASNAVAFLRDSLNVREDLLRGYGLGLVPEQFNVNTLTERLPEMSEDLDCRYPRKEAVCYLDSFKPVVGNIVLPHTDAQHCITGFRVIDLQGRVRDYRLFPGCFHSLTFPGAGQNHPLLAQRIIVVSDEIAALRMQHALVERGFNPATAIATGAIAKMDWATLDALGGDEARRALSIGNASPHASILSLPATVQRHFTTDGYEISVSQGNLESLIGPAQPNDKIVANLVAAHEQARTLYRPFAELKRDIFKVRAELAGASQDFIANREAARLVLRDLQRRGEFLLCENSPYWMDGETKQVVPLGGREGAFVTLLAGMGVVASEGVFRFLSENLLTEAQKRGREVALHRFAFWNEISGRLYIDLRTGAALVLDGVNPPTTVPNGTDGVLFAPISDTAPFDATATPPAASAWDEVLLGKIRFAEDGFLTPAERRFLLTIYLLQIFFESIAPTKPLAVFIGVKGSGKSSTCRITGKVLVGEKFDVSSVARNLRDLETHLTNSYLAVLDNADDCGNKINDLLAVASTGGTIKRRELFTTNKMNSYVLRCWTMITTRTPKFHRDDVADRTLPFRVERMNDGFIEENLLQSMVANNRDAMWAEMIDALQATARLLKQTPAGTQCSKLRLADFAGFGHRIAKGLGLERFWERLLQNLIRDQSEFTLSGHVVYEALKIWLRNDANWGRELETAELFNELTQIAEDNNIAWLFKHAQSFGMSIAGLNEALNQFFDVIVIVGRARAKFWTFKRKTKTDAPAQSPDAPIIENPAITSTLLRKLYDYANAAAVERTAQSEREKTAAEQRRLNPPQVPPSSRFGWIADRPKNIEERRAEWAANEKTEEPATPNLTEHQLRILDSQAKMKARAIQNGDHETVSAIDAMKPPEAEPQLVYGPAEEPKPPVEGARARQKRTEKLKREQKAKDSEAARAAAAIPKPPFTTDPADTELVQLLQDIGKPKTPPEQRSEAS